MKLLLDTCVFLWSVDETENLSATARKAVQDSANEIVFHQISVLEIQIKHSLGKLPLQVPPSQFIANAESSLGTIRHNLDDPAMSLLGNLPWIHRDPFDRVLISHAVYHGLTLVTPDPNIHRYPVRVLW
ncbi:MAG: type II toxin-antitoxin system VapC family toxin [bacterium]